MRRLVTLSYFLKMSLEEKHIDNPRNGYHLAVRLDNPNLDEIIRSVFTFVAEFAKPRSVLFRVLDKTWECLFVLNKSMGDNEYLCTYIEYDSVETFNDNWWHYYATRMFQH